MNRSAALFVLLPALAGALLVALPCAAAQQSSPPPAASGPGPATLHLSLAETIDRARASSPRLGQLRALRDASDAVMHGAKAERLPLVDVTASYTRYSGVPELVAPFPPPAGPTTIFPNLPNSYASRLGVSVPLYTGGRLAQQVVAAGREHDAAEKDLAAGAADLVLDTTAVYWDLVTAIESERVLSEAVASYEAHLKDAGNRKRLGIASHSEFLAVQVERDRAELARLRAANEVEVVGANLSRILGLPTGTRIEPHDPLDGPAPAQEATPDLIGAALAARPERAALKARIDAADARARAARADRRPQARFGAGYDYANPNRRILPPVDRWQDSWDVSVTLSFRVFDGGRTAAAVAQRSAQAEAARQQLDDLERRIRYEVTERALDLKTAAAAVEVAARNVEAAQESRRESADRYRAGLVPSSELLDAEVALLRAGLDRAEAQAKLRLAQVALDRAVGR